MSDIFSPYFITLMIFIINNCYSATLHQSCHASAYHTQKHSLQTSLLFHKTLVRFLLLSIMRHRQFLASFTNYALTLDELMDG